MHDFDLQNKDEARSCVRIARRLEKENKDYCIITAYDAQRQLIEDMLKGENLRWEHKVFNVDS
jgi:superfamily I DNA and/or RNA helicase